MKMKKRELTDCEYQVIYKVINLIGLFCFTFEVARIAAKDPEYFHYNIKPFMFYHPYDLLPDEELDRLGITELHR